jgi:hypothetical protein
LKFERVEPYGTVRPMEKTIRTSVGMSSDSPLLPAVAAVLAFKAAIPGTVSAETQQKIANLRGILDSKTFSSARNGGDWRRGSSSSSVSSLGQEPRWRYGPGGPRAGGYMKSSSSQGSLSAGSQTPRTPQGERPPSRAQASPGPYTGPPLGRYTSRFKSSSEPIEEKILNRIIRLKLNKFGPTTYTEIREFLYQILGQESIDTEDDGKISTEEGQVAEFVKDFMLMVFKKAAAEEIYCPLYAKLLSEIGAKHSVIFEEMNSLYQNYLEIFEEADVNVASGDNESFEKKNLEKKYRQGYSQFIAELTTLEILPLECLLSTYHTLIQQIQKHGGQKENKPLIEEYVDCLLRMSRVMKEKQSLFFTTARNKLFLQNKDILDSLINLRDGTYPSLSPKARFLLMDIRDILSV